MEKKKEDEREGKERLWKDKKIKKKKEMRFFSQSYQYYTIFAEINRYTVTKFK